MLAETSPRKKDQIKIGKLSIKKLARFIKTTRLDSIPEKSIIKKVPLNSFQNPFKPSLFKVLNNEKFILLIELINSL